MQDCSAGTDPSIVIVLVGAVYQCVNKLQNEKNEVPSSAEEGWMRDEKEIAKPPKIRADGVVLVQFQQIS